jgi:hypothetical protein
MAGESPKTETDDQVEALVDELIGKIFSEPGGPTDRSMRDMATTAALFEAAFGARPSSRTSMLERVLVAQAFAGELADALAPALAEQIAPRLMSALEQLTTPETGGKQQTSNGRSGGQTRKTEPK